MPKRPLFVTRKFPPSVGGMETLAANVWASLLGASAAPTLIAHRGTNRHLVWWLPAAVARVIGQVRRGRADVVLCGDALTLAFMSPFLRVLSIPYATMVMGLDVTFENRVYRALVYPALRRCPCVIAISRATAEAVRQAGVPSNAVNVLRLGVEVPEFSPEERSSAASRLRHDLLIPESAAVLVTLGRLVRRKGVAWFIDEVLPQLPEDVYYVVVGDGPDGDRVAASAAASRAASRIRLVGRVDDEEREVTLRGADLFVQPNVLVAGDMEGFGLVTVEAALRGVVVVASDLEGLADAVIDGVSGHLVPPGSPDEWVSILTALVSDREHLAVESERFRRAAAAEFGRESMGQALLGVLSDYIRGTLGTGAAESGSTGAPAS